MNLDQSLFASETVHEKEIETGDGTKHILWFKELPQVKFNAYQEAVRSQDADVRASSVAKLIALSLVTPDGKPAISFEDAARLKPQVANSIVGRILEVNGFASTEKKD